MIRYLLDIDMCFRLAQGEHPHARRRLENTRRGELGLSIITHGELCLAGGPLATGITDIVPIVSLEAAVAPVYGALRAQVDRMARPLGTNRLWLAAHALHLDAAIVTFSSDLEAEGLHVKTENWLAQAPLSRRRRAS